MNETVAKSRTTRRSLVIVMLVYWAVFGCFALTLWRQISHIPEWRNALNFNQV